MSKYDFSSVGKTKSDIREQVIAYGMIKMLNDWNKRDICARWIKESPETIEKYLPYFRGNQFESLYSQFRKYNPERVLTSPNWKNYFNNVVKDASYAEMKSYSFLNGAPSNAGALVDLYFDCLSQKIESKSISKTWTDIYLDYSKYVVKPNGYYNYKSRQLVKTILPRIATGYFKENPTTAKNILYDVAFKSKDIEERTAYYKGYIEAGFLDKKIARRIRSEPSENVAVSVLEFLMNHLNKYEDPKLLLTQFVDIKHRYAQQVLAKQAPDYMVPFMMAFEDPVAKKELERRAVEISKQKDKAKELKNG